MSFQAAITTDGSLSFATFIYEPFPAQAISPTIVGFDAGDEKNGMMCLININSDHRIFPCILGEKSLYRIDGECKIEIIMCIKLLTVHMQEGSYIAEGNLIGSIILV